MQAADFGDLDGLRMAAEMEKRGGAFYTLASRVSRSKSTRDLLTALAADEAVHLQEFTLLYEKEAARGEVRRYPAETGAYLAALAADVAFPKGVVGLKDGVDNPRAILNAAIASEEDSIRFYTEMARATDCEQTRRVFNDIIRQEDGHLHRLQKMLSELK